MVTIIFIIGLAWITVLAVAVALCRAAARGDREAEAQEYHAFNERAHAWMRGAVT